MLSVSYLLYSVLLDCSVNYFVRTLPARSFFFPYNLLCSGSPLQLLSDIYMRGLLKTTKASRLCASPNPQPPTSLTREDTIVILERSCCGSSYTLFGFIYTFPDVLQL
jgi:hypothetical protein